MEEREFQAGYMVVLDVEKDDLAAKEERLYPSGDVTNIVGISTRQLYYWELKGIVCPIEKRAGSRRYKRYTEKDIIVLKKVKEYLSLGYTLRSALRKIERFKRDMEAENVWTRK